eukprot:4780690-Pyramimonas_sp.AAC.1
MTEMMTMMRFGLSQVWFKPFQVIRATSDFVYGQMPLSVLGWVHAWDILDVNTNKKYNTAALMRWKQILKLVFMAIAMTRHPA